MHLHGIDAPEEDQPFGDRAREFAAKAVRGAPVQIVPIAKDRGGRLVADVFLSDGQLLSYLLVKEGYAWWARTEAFDHVLLQQLEADARKARRGLWADVAPIAPWEWRQRSSEGARSHQAPRAGADRPKPGTRPGR